MMSRINFEKVSTNEFISMLNALYSVNACLNVDNRLFYVSGKDIIQKIEKEDFKELSNITIPTFFYNHKTLTYMSGISGSWTYSYKEGFFERISRQGRCS